MSSARSKNIFLPKMYSHYLEKPHNFENYDQ